LFGRYPPAYFVLIIVGFLLVMSGGMANAFIPIQAKQLDPSGLLIGLVVSSYHLVRLFFELPSGVISDIVGRKRLILLGIAMAVGGAIFCSFATSIYFLIVGRALWGFGAALFFLNNTVVIMNMFEPERRGKALGIFQSLEIVGNVFGQPFGAFIAEFLGFSASYYISAAIVGGGVIPMLISGDFSKRASISVEKSNHHKIDISRIVKNPYLLITCLAVFIRMMINRGIIGTVFQIYLVDYLAVSLGLVGVALMIRSAGFSLTTIGAGFLVDRFGGRLVVILGTAIGATSMFMYTLVKSLGFMVPVMILDGFASGMISVSILVVLSNQVDSTQTGSAVGLYRTFQDAGAVAGPIIMMVFYDTFNAYSSFYVAALVLVLTIPFLLCLPKRKVEAATLTN
jgi:DHA1 family multidrug resistance protein-like MFS transporter